MNLAELQDAHRQWVAHNFPNQKRWEPLLGLQEEVGELSHAFLKFHQGIRGYDEEKFMNEACDAVGDIVIYLASFCNANGIELDFAVWDAWQTVKKRNWVADPQKGGT